MAKVTGIDGVFFRAQNPNALAAWCATHLGRGAGPAPWQQAAGPSVFARFAADSDYVPAARQVMLNLRVDDLPALIMDLNAAGPDLNATGPDLNAAGPDLNAAGPDLNAAGPDLNAAGIATETRAEPDGRYGQFARSHDPKGHPVELWQPPAP